MRIVKWTEDGYQRQAIVRDDDSDGVAAQGIPLGPPDVGRIDLSALGLDPARLEDARRVLHNELVAQDLLMFEDVQRSGTGVKSAVRKVIKKAGIQFANHAERREVETEVVRNIVRHYRRKH